MRTTPPNVERLTYSVEDAMAATGLGRSTFYELIGNGTLRTIKIGRRRLVPVDALRDFIDNADKGAA